jgi:hypothetical protein
MHGGTMLTLSRQVRDIIGVIIAPFGTYATLTCHATEPAC